MGLADWFKRRTLRPETEIVWMGSAAKLNGIARQIAERTKSDSVVVVLAHFRDTLTDVEAVLRQAGIAFEPRQRVGGSEILAFGRQSGVAKVLTALTDDLAFDPLDDDQPPSRAASIILTERHPLRDKDNAVVDFAGAVPCALLIHVSLEDPLMRAFAGEKTLAILRQLGMKETDALEHPHITASIRRAQQSIEQKAIGDLPGQSVQEWFRRNCPELASAFT